MKKMSSSSNPEMRWVQRYSHFSKALSQLSKFIAKGELNELEEQGIIQAFEYTYELAWNLLKDYFEAQGETNIHGSRDAFRLAFRRGLITEGEIWMNMIKDRTLSVHTYNEATAKKISQAVFEQYYPEFVQLSARFQQIKDRTT
ncbi:MAG: nucleotidyltransferase substrate binding protein [Anaerolineales bacterium]|nr:nucleotidyltransferase substrate binding protein [Anaerolineales bacterium]